MKDNSNEPKLNILDVFVGILLILLFLCLVIISIYITFPLIYSLSDAMGIVGDLYREFWTEFVKEIIS